MHRKFWALLSALALLWNLLPTAPVFASSSTYAPYAYTASEGYGGTLSSEPKVLYNFFVEKLIDPSTGLCKANAPSVITLDFTDNNFTYFSSDELSDDIIYAANAFTLDYPEVFWFGEFDVEISTENIRGRSILREISFELEKTTPAEINEHNAGVIKAAAEITASLDSNDNFAYYKAIHNWLLDHLTFYEGGDSSIYSSLTAFAGDGRVVCESYAKSFKILTDWFRNNENIPLYAATIIGTGNSGEGHAWNDAYLNGSWYGIDATWDDQIDAPYTYFMAGSLTPGTDSTFSGEHQENDRYNDAYEIHFARPTLSNLAYVPRYTVNYVLNGGTNSSFNPENFTFNSGKLPLAAPTSSEGTTFLGWYTDPAFKNRISEIDTTHAADLTIYAKWADSTADAPAAQMINDTSILLTINSTTALVNGTPSLLDAAPTIINNRTMLPLRFIAENFGCTVSWNAENSSILIIKDTTQIQLQIGSSSAWVNNAVKTLDAPPVIQNARTLIPVRFIAENLGLTVNWNAAAQSVLITK